MIECIQIPTLNGITDEDRWLDLLDKGGLMRES